MTRDRNAAIVRDDLAAIVKSRFRSPNWIAIMLLSGLSLWVLLVLPILNAAFAN